MRYWKGWMYLKESLIRRWKGESRGGQDERKFNEKKWKGGKVGVCLGERSVRKWKG